MIKRTFRNLIFVYLIILVSSGIYAQIRTADCYGVNKDNPTWGMTNDSLIFNTPVAYTDGVSEPAGKNRPNPRVISNTLFVQDKFMKNEKNLSDYMFIWGQFIDHDMTLVTDDASQPFYIQVPIYDPWMDPFGSGSAIIPMSRSNSYPGTGTSLQNPRKFANAITAYMDASVVYGSTDQEAAWIRTFSNGKLKTSAGNLLPYNTLTGELGSEIDPNTPFMDMRGSTEKHFVAGERRVNENPLLTSIHTIFVREHNLQCDKIRSRHPEWTDEQIYQRARKIIGGFIQNITFTEWFNSLTGSQLPDYSGYNSKINPQISNLFSAAGFRLGHTLINSVIMRMDQTSHHMGNSEMRLADAFFKPSLIRENDGIEYFIKGSCYQSHQRFDTKIIDDLRNMLFGPVGAGGLDLAAINIQRGRERGLADYNTLRKSYGLEVYTSFKQITDDPKAVMDLYNLYNGDIDNIDPFVGLLAEKHKPNSNVGELMEAVLSEQFIRLRDGDPFYFLSDPELAIDEIYEIANTKFGDIVRRNTNMNNIPRDIFITEPDLFEIRTITGLKNNIENPDWGCSFTPLVRFGTNGYTDKISKPAGENRPNPREISNRLFAQNGNLFDNLELSDYVFNWGQFLDHDLSIINDSKDPFFIKVPKGDIFFDPDSTGEKYITLFRSLFAETSGTSESNPRNSLNELSAYVDGSNVYGSTDERTNWLRAFHDGKLKVSEGNMLPYNTNSGEHDGEVDSNAPKMAHPITPADGRWHIAGDERANENPLLIAIHTIWMREHNRVCDELKTKNPLWNDEVLFQEARRIVIAKIENITFNEYLPAMGVNLSTYTGYKDEVMPQITNVFSAAAFRYGHTIINGNILRLNNDCSIYPSGHTRLKDTYFYPGSIKIETDNQLEPYLFGMMHQRQQGLDIKVIDDVRNFLFGQPGQGGMDLVSLNIQRGRERGLADYNTIRKDYGLTPITSFSQITSNKTLSSDLEDLYKNVNDIDFWVGMLSEDHIPGSIFGPLGNTIIKRQFEDLRDGDRFFFEIDKGLSEEQKMEIRYTKWSDVIGRNTSMENLPKSIFFYQGSCTDVKDLFVDKSSVNVYPNPSLNTLNLEFEGNENTEGKIEIVNMLGQTLVKDNIVISDSYNHFNYDISNLNSGIYIINIRSDKGQLSKQFVKL